MMKLKLAGLISVAAIALASAAHATVIYDNIGASTSLADSISYDGPLADSFSTGSSAFDLTSVSVLLQQFVADPPYDSTSVALVADNNTSPGALIANIGTVSDSDLQYTPTVYSFSTNVELAANTRYWIQLTSTSTSSADWDYSFDQSGVGVAGEYFAEDGGNFVFPNVDAAYQMKLSGDVGSVSAAPEPATWALMFGGLAMIGGMLRIAKARRREEEVSGIATA